MEMTRLTKRNHYEEIKDQLMRMILDGTFKVGDKLPSTKEMSERFGVGRSTTREALSALKAMGLIEIRQGGGCRVVHNAPAEVAVPELDSLRLNRGVLLDLLEARQSLEVSNAAIAAVKRTDADLAGFAALMSAMGQAIGQELEGERTDVLFHLTLAKATHNSIMVRLFESIVGQLETAIRDIRRVEIYSNQEVAERLYREHSAIYEAVRLRDPELASQTMKRHLEHVENILTKYI
ncbi:GntR family transcriptional regulator [Cohnella sp. CIP 111063]|uniref:FadR/GntR family transcriptional regulator n=1 Tax=unclassified Cohnella TaxID=2636738 RepID=UPI000B8C07C4|nr:MULTISPECIES: FadR/GntR family transcriptional regulator [unclassified Cohnella]OXS60943.1 GntR family transcriptional regulator [Cohnella sp. CIP 111063]PRX73477.1 DNA-binding FadR family transcriptional regulator [Cohnella sp. SGD-V74]